MNSKKKLVLRGALLLILAAAILFSIQLTTSISFTTSPSISPSSSTRPDTNDTLICSWNASVDMTQQNVTWYKNGNSLLNDTNINISQSTLSSDYTSRGEIWNCTVTLSNGSGSVNQTVNVTIQNAPPPTSTVINSTGQDIGNLTTVVEDQWNNFTLSSIDPDGDKVTYGSYDTLPINSTFNAQTGVFSWRPEQYVDYDTNITFYAKDNQTPFANTNKFVMFLVDYVNDAPVFAPALANQSIKEGDRFNYYIIATDEENNTPLNFTMSVDSGLPLTINTTSNTSAVIMFTGNDTARYDASGNYTVNVTVNDSLGASTMSSFVLKINDSNVNPVIRRPILNYSGNQTQSFNFSVYADDFDVNDTLNFSITALDCPLAGLTYPVNPWNITTVNNSNNATGLVNVTALINNHVVCYHVNITVIDVNAPGAEDSQDVFLNISNTNDPPNVEALSSSSNNTGGNNISQLLAYAEAPFVYLINATDIDQLTRFGDALTFSSNSSFFIINSSTGLISFTPNQSMVGNQTINITVTDNGGLSNSRIMNLEIKNNSAPVLQPIGNLSCAAEFQCLIIINATDAENQNLTFTSNNSDMFNITNNLSQNPVWSAYVNYTPNHGLIGNYSILVTVADIRGASDNETIRLTINFTNDPPVLHDLSFPKIVETHPVVLNVFADDYDYDLSSKGIYEHVIFNSTNVSGENLFNITTETNTSNNQTYGLIYFVPQEGTAGNYSVNISAKDYYNATNYTIKNFTVYQKTNPPNISQIRPYGLPFSNTTVFNFTDTSNYATPLTSIEFPENTTVLYNITVIDNSTPTANLTFGWYINGALDSTNNYLNRSYDFFSSRSYNITVIVTNDYYENASWTWNVTVDNVNRAPLFINPLGNVTINTSTRWPGYLSDSGGIHFIDPDDDFDSDGYINASNNESSTLAYSVSTCDAAEITMQGPNVTFTPKIVGSCLVVFTASDGEFTNTSNVVVINVTNVPNATEQTPIQQPTSGGGGGQSRSVITPIQKQEDKPKALELIVPKLVTIYENKTVLIPIRVQNNWNSTLKEIRLNASTNASEVQLKFSDDYFPEMAKGEKKDVTLMVDNYRLGSNYEIDIIANVTEPKASDSALVLLNAIEQSQSGQEVETKVTFAQDLLTENPECLELNELLGKAKDALAKGSTNEASKMVDGVINGCKYLVSISKKNEQKPESIVNRLIQRANLKFLIIFIGIAVIFTLAVLVIKKNKTKATKEKAEEAEKAEEKEIKPYW